MKRLFLVQHLIRAGCELVSEEPTHSNWTNPANGMTAEVPRQQEIPHTDAKRIYDDLGIGDPMQSFTTVH